MSKNLDESGLKSIFSEYDLFFIDIWGVVHNGIKLHENAVKVLEELYKNEKKFILLPNAPKYKCPSWMDADTCTTLSNACGNGVCDAHELCNTCQFDCGCGGAQVCNAQTGKCHSPAGVCQAPRGAGA